MKRGLLLTLVALNTALLAACGDGDHENIRQWMADNSKNLRGGIAKLPEIKPYEAVSYEVEALPNPFSPEKVENEVRSQKAASNSILQPDFEAREIRNSILEKFPLESLRMIGVFNINHQPMAVVQVEDKIKQVKTGDYVGQDFGKVTKINDTSIDIQEMIQDPAGDWSERKSSLYLQSTEGSKK